jgi:lon-related putative ATP-dependent protease
VTNTLPELTATQLRRRGEVQALSFSATDELPELTEIIGQERATRAIEFGIDIPAPGYNVFAMGPSGAGKTSTIERYLERKASTQEVPADWGYVDNFRDAQSPDALPLPPGGGCALRDKLDALLDGLSAALSQAFDSEQYGEHQQKLSRDLDEKRKVVFKQLEVFAAERGFAIGQTPMGLMLAPLVDGKVLGREEYMALPEERRSQFEAKEPEVQEALQATLRKVRDLEQEAKDRLRNLDQEVAKAVITPLFQPLAEAYRDWEEVVSYLEAVQSDIVGRIGEVRAALSGGEEPEGEQQMPQWLRPAGSPFDRYRINVVVDHRVDGGAPVVLETNPTYANLIGRLEHRAELGTLVTDYRMIRGGALHRANGGYLVVDARALLRQPLAWDALKRSLRHKEVRIEDAARQMGLVATVSLTPEPIPLSVKVVLIGDTETYYLLYSLDEEFQKLFKVRADFAVDMDWNPENVEKLARFIHDRCEENGLPHFGPEAVMRVVEYASRLVEDQRKLTARFAYVQDLVLEAGYWAREAGHDHVLGEDVQKAIDERVYRANQLDERTREFIADGTIMVDTAGEVVGQVNGLSVVSLGDHQFGRPNRITANAYLGQQGVINIEREAKLSGRIYDKAALILSGYLGGKYAQEAPLSLSASLAFEQSYSGIEGDSASVAEACALLSSIAHVPIRQSLAVTGSINQKGEVQAIGGATYKIEGFFDVCRAAAGGLTGEQGVVIPATNVRHLMLRDDVVEAVEKGLFHVYPVRTVDEALVALTGLETGTADEEGRYPEDSVNGRVQASVRRLAEQLKAFGREGDKKPGKENEQTESEEEEPSNGDGSAGDDDAA